jgi:hypothetical protein
MMQSVNDAVITRKWLRKLVQYERNLLPLIAIANCVNDCVERATSRMAADEWGSG